MLGHHIHGHDRLYTAGGEIGSYADFTGAVRALLDMYCPDVDSRDLYVNGTPKEDESSHAAETMYIYNRYAYEFFRAEYEADNPEAAACRAYAERHSEDSGNGRWDAWFCEMFGLGYSPLRGNRFLAYARGKGLKTEILLALGLIGEDEARPGNYYDFYRGRLMIPQRDRFGRIQTFTARSLQPHATVKYLNGKDCLIYRKSTAVFGIDVALKAARQTGKVYLVEGAPDVMRLQSIGIANVVASLGGAWTREQLGQFSKFGCTLCFIPDADTPKGSGRFGAGEKFVFRNGRLATEMGFQVSVREIPRRGGVKQDADSYITSLQVWEILNEKDFILWYADKHYDPDGTNDDQLKVISDVCDLLVNIHSEVMQASLLADLKYKYKKASVWKGTLADAARRLQESKRRQAIRKSDELEGFRFYRKGYHYYDIDQQGREREWTNFIIRPLFLIADESKPTRIFELENESRVRKTIELQQADVTKLERFKVQIEGKGNFRFFEKPEKYELLKAYIYEKTEEAHRITQMGWNDLGNKGFYAFCNGIVYEGKWRPVDEYGIVRLDNENFYLPAMSRFHKKDRAAYLNERRYLHDPKRDVPPEEYFSLVADLYGDNGIVAVCFYLATLFRDIITAKTRLPSRWHLFSQAGLRRTWGNLQDTQEIQA